MSEDLSAPPSKKTKTKSNDDKGEGSEMHYRDFSLRISDGFMRTIGDIVKVVVCSGASIMMLRELKVSKFMNVINELAKGVGLKTKCIPGSTIVEVNADPPLTSDQLEEFRTSLKSRLQDLLPVKANLVVKVLDEKIKNAPEPLLQDSEFAKFVLCWLQEELRKKASKLTPDLEDFMNLRDAAEKMEELIMESESRTKVSILSQNGKGKSFFLNRMLSLTSDSFDEYAVNNKEVYLPQPLNPTTCWTAILSRTPNARTPEITLALRHRGVDLEQGLRRSVTPGTRLCEGEWECWSEQTRICWLFGLEKSVSDPGCLERNLMKHWERLKEEMLFSMLFKIFSI